MDEKNNNKKKMTFAQYEVTTKRTELKNNF